MKVNGTPLTVGQIVTVKDRQLAYNTGGRGYPAAVYLNPGDLAVVGAVDVPAVTRNKDFACLDFCQDGRMYRTSAYAEEIRRVKSDDRYSRILTVGYRFTVPKSPDRPLTGGHDYTIAGVAPWYADEMNAPTLWLVDVLGRYTNASAHTLAALLNPDDPARSTQTDYYRDETGSPFCCAAMSCLSPAVARSESGSHFCEKHADRLRLSY